ncbi:hypothetical protein PTTG_00979 [Puccinia triticina 1-1 BBBD Race 1]|uniref:Uncharacterized protein n=2 Tax=Puccinia triticina TaxID=208348 RepID=A0A0C4EJQ8_PUCT1|nr:uncharacterized protein PtA15_3A734 [Puccinia triticina]OAV96530.1 hypothetical protein PTTG_00979 [Puccinia triticina 1-1 BBBD Race 1]WAQ83364.1 hypothetical protein PtA15_3A734 [Puccinia triticina]WAR54211.1 hypothetical protein PtB15_3B725 [Puccinia triticina]
MANSQERAMSGLIESFSSLGNEGSSDQIKYHEVVVANEIGRISDAYYTLSDNIVNRPDPLVLFNQVEIRTELIDQLKSKHFPSLKRQVTALSNALISRSNPKTTPISQLKLALKALSKLDVTLGKIKFAVACINPGLDPQEVRHDQDFKKAKQATCSRLGLIANVVTGNICDFLRNCHRFMVGSGLAVAVEDAQRRREMLAMAHISSVSIDRALEFMNMSELNFIRDGWQSHIDSMDDCLQKFITFCNRPAPQSKHRTRSRPVNEDRNTRSNIAPLRGQPRTITSVIALIKITRMLLAKLQHMSADKENFSMVTNLTSRELDIFTQMATMLAESIEKLVEALCGDIDGDQFEDIMTIHDSISQLQTFPKTIFFMADHIFLPVVHQADQPSHKMYYKAWFYQWNRLHQLAAQNFLDAFRFNPT